MHKKKQLYRALLLILYPILSIVIIILANNKVFALLLITVMLIIIALFNNYKQNIFLILFILCYTFFLLGEPIAEEIFGYTHYSRIQLTEETKQIEYAILEVSIVCVIIGYYIKNKIINNNNNNKKKNINNKTTTINNYGKNIKEITKFTTISFYIIEIIRNVLRFIFVRQVGYTESYAIEQYNKLPFMLNILAELAPISLCIFLACMPTKKETKIPILLLIISNIISLIIGNRFEIISSILMILIYYIWRNETDSEKWIKKRAIVILLMTSPAIMIGLNNISYTRIDREFSNEYNGNTAVIELLGNAGATSRIIGATVQNGDKFLSSEILYSFGNVWRAYNQNIITKAFASNNTTSYNTQTEEMAKNGHSLSSAITYYYYKDKYLKGYGLGGCYIAELYHDFSWIGVIVGNIILGIIIAATKNIDKTNLLKNYLAILSIMVLLKIPRDSFDILIIQLMSIRNILFMTTVIMISKIISKKNNNIKEKL